MLARSTPRSRIVFGTAALALLVLGLAGCKCTEPANPPPVQEPMSAGGAPEVKGRARFDRSLTGVPNIRLDLKVTQGGKPYTAYEMLVWWASHDTAGPPVYTADPKNPRNHPPSDDWVVECIEATHDANQDHFHVKVALNDPSGLPLGTTDRALPLVEAPFSFCQTWYLFPSLK